MCLVFIVKNIHPDYPLIIAANRDEFYQRESTSLMWWDAPSDIVAGRDQVAGGTWLGLNITGKIAAITNFRSPEKETRPLSRGKIPLDFLGTNTSIESFCENLIENKDNYNPFNCLFGNINPASMALYCYNNQSNTKESIEDGIHGLSNAHLNTDWPKVLESKDKIAKLCKSTFNDEAWFDFMKNTTKPEDHQLPDTGVGIELERLLSSRFIHSAEYGTRCTSLIKVDQSGNCIFSERTYNPDAEPILTKSFRFNIKE